MIDDEATTKVKQLPLEWMLTHAVEAYVSTIATSVTDSAVLMALKLCGFFKKTAVKPLILTLP